MNLHSTHPHKATLSTNARDMEYWPIDSLSVPARQARLHSPDQIEKIKYSFQTFGFLGALLIDTTGEIIAGVARFEAAKQLGYDELPVLIADHLNKAQIKAYRLADNKLAEHASWDDDILRAEFEAIHSVDVDFDLEVTGFETAEIDLLLDYTDLEDNPDDSQPDETDLPAISQFGDLWQLGPHRLLCGDAKSASDYESLLGGDSPCMVITDPPWNAPINGHVGNSGAVQHREFIEASGEMTNTEFASFLGVVIQRMADYVEKGALILCFIDWRGIDKVLASGNKAGLELLNILVWNKNNAGLGSLYRSKHELICLFKKPRAPHQNNIKLGSTGRYRTNVWDYAGANSFGKGRMDQLTAHPTAKPVVMIADAIKDVTKRGDFILDPFCGSGTALLAAERTGRIARCMELDPLYVDTAIRRFEKLFQTEAFHIRTGLTFAELGKQRAQEAESAPDTPSMQNDLAQSGASLAPKHLARKRQRPVRSVSSNAHKSGREA